MTLAAIRELRLAHKKPADVLTIVIGDAPKRWKEDPSCIELKPGSQPRLMDWRPVVGLWSAFYLLTPDWVLMDSTIDCVGAAGGRLFGFAHKGVGYPLVTPTDVSDVNLTPQAAFALTNIWDSLCR